MRRKDKEITDSQKIINIIKSARICRLAFNHEPYPYIIPVNYGYKDNCLYFHSAKSGTKIDLIKSLGKASFEIEEFHEIIKSDISCEWTTQYRSVIGAGKISMIENDKEKQEALDILMQHHGKAENAYDEKLLRRVAVGKLEIIELSAKESI